MNVNCNSVAIIHNSNYKDSDFFTETQLSLSFHHSGHCFRVDIALTTKYESGRRKSDRKCNLSMSTIVFNSNRKERDLC